MSPLRPPWRLMGLSALTAISLPWTLIAVAALVVVGLLLPLDTLIATLIQLMHDAGALGIAAYAVVYLVATVLLIPGSLVTLAAGMVYGPWWGLGKVHPRGPKYKQTWDMAKSTGIMICTTRGRSTPSGRHAGAWWTSTGTRNPPSHLPSLHLSPLSAWPAPRAARLHAQPLAGPC